MGSTNPQRWTRVRGASGMHLVSLRSGVWYQVHRGPQTAAAHMRDDIWLELDGRLQWFGRPSGLEFWEGEEPPE